MKRTLFTILFFISIFYCYSVDFECNVSEHSLIKYNKIPGKGQENPYKETSIAASTIVGKCGGSGTDGIEDGYYGTQSGFEFTLHTTVKIGGEEYEVMFVDVDEG